MSTGNSQPPVNRLATGLRMATVIVVLGTLAAIWHPGTSGPATAVSDGMSTASTDASPAAAAATTYFPAQFPAPEHAEPQAPTF